MTAIAMAALSATNSVGRAAYANIENTSRPVELVPSQCSADGADGWATLVSKPNCGS